MYDEFGNLKKKFRAKTQQAETTQAVPGVGRAGWEVEELGIINLSEDYIISFFCLMIYQLYIAIKYQLCRLQFATL